MQGVKEEAIELRDSTQETLVKEEIEETNSSKKRDFIIIEYRCVIQRKLLCFEKYLSPLLIELLMIGLFIDNVVLTKFSEDYHREYNLIKYNLMCA